MRKSNFLKSKPLKSGLNIFLPLFFVLAIIRCNQFETNSYTQKISAKEILPSLQEGDLILKYGFGNVSNLIASYLSEKIPLSHCGIVIKNEQGLFGVAHSVSGEIAKTDGVHWVGLERFLQDVRLGSLYILRHKSEQHMGIVQHAKRYLRNKTPFDIKFDRSDTTKLYCSEFVDLVFFHHFQKHYFSPNLKVNPDVYAFNSVLDHPDFDLIIHR